MDILELHSGYFPYNAPNDIGSMLFLSTLTNQFYPINYYFKYLFDKNLNRIYLDSLEFSEIRFFEVRDIIYSFEKFYSETNLMYYLKLQVV